MIRTSLRAPRYATALAALSIVAGAVFVAAPPAPVGSDPRQATLYRDRWGVPHIWAGSREAAAYAHGYAQAEDRLEDVLGAYLLAVGRAASVFGESRLDSDKVARLARHEQVARERYASLSAATRETVEAFVAGVVAYMRENPEAVPPWGFEPEPVHVVALYRAFAWVWPWGQARGELERAADVDPGDRGSNAWVVGPSRSALSGPIALIDPHLSWEPQNRLYEAHVHGGAVNFFGFSIPGTPLMAVGHTDTFSLALTTGGPDCADVYEERIHPDDPLKYEYDGAWRAIEVEEVSIQVKTAGGTRTESLRVERTHHGPILRREGLQAWAVKTAYDAEIGIVEQWRRIAEARNLGDFIDAMRANQSLPQNVLYADVQGNTYYVRAGRVPVRSQSYAFDRPVPGWTSETEWKGVHPFSDLVQALNPPPGYMQNCNTSPDEMMPDSPLRAESYVGYLYNVRSGRSTGRGRRALELLAANERLDLEQAQAIAMDTYVDGVDLWKRAAMSALATHAEAYPNLGEAVRLLGSWNGRMDVDSRGAALFRSWMAACRVEGSGVPLTRIESGEVPEGADALALLDALQLAASEMRRHFGRIDVPWGEVNRVRRGERSWPVAGCRADGISTLRSVRSSPPDDSGVGQVVGGAVCTTLVVLGQDGISSYSVTPFGQSEDPESSHFADQGEFLFAASLLKPTWYALTDLLENVESQKTLRYVMQAPQAPRVAADQD